MQRRPGGSLLPNRSQRLLLKCRFHSETCQKSTRCFALSSLQYNLRTSLDHAFPRLSSAQGQDLFQISIIETAYTQPLRRFFLASYQAQSCFNWTASPLPPKRPGISSTGASCSKAWTTHRPGQTAPCSCTARLGRARPRNGQ
jgi:hypothetical protein